MNNKISQDEKKKAIENIRLAIPDYQRPYKWTARNAIRLLDDIIEARNDNKEVYRVGTLILHREFGPDGQMVYNIVDGQQRTITFALLLYALSEIKNEKGVTKCAEIDLLGQEVFDNQYSRRNIPNNLQAFRRRVKGMGNSDSKTDHERDMQRLYEYVKSQCELIVVITDDLSEAFQFFDSQNARGKALYPHDLLKAYHLREMRDVDADSTESIVKEWEAISQRKLANLFSDLYNAWGEDEIRALVEDVYDSYCKDKGYNVYYIGTLVTYDCDENIYEVIDGQQRLTTIYLILKAFEQKNVLPAGAIVSKLTYTARRVSAKTLEKIPVFNDECDKGIEAGYNNAINAIDNVVESDRLEGFVDYFLHSVHIVHYHVPKDVDLNHYFEVMNSRGEQLEKHEIVKSKLAQQLKDDMPDFDKFCRIWEACSEMNVYIQQIMPDNSVFGSKLDSLVVRCFDDIPAQNVSADKKTIRGLIDEGDCGSEPKEDIALADKFLPIIDFQNFLLQVLKLTLFKTLGKSVTDFTLDDKELLHEFDAALGNSDDKADFVKKFAYNLLICRYFLDNYIVHHLSDAKEQISDNPWKLQCYCKEKSKGYPRDLNDKDSEEGKDAQKEMLALLSMFEVSFSPKQRKNYLFYCLCHLCDNRSVPDYLPFLRSLANKYFFDVYLNKACLSDRNQPVPNAFDTAILGTDGKLKLELECAVARAADLFENTVYRVGSANIPLFVFNYTDYKIWKKYACELRGERTNSGSQSRKDFFAELGCTEFKNLEAFNSFYFSRTRKSLEHYYPQAKAVADAETANIADNSDEGTEAKHLSTTQINCFGNFAMIGADANSSGSNWDPKTKLDQYTDTKTDPVSVASLKFQIMMQICRDNSHAGNRPAGMEWNAEDMRIHQKKMLAIVCVE